MKFGEALELLRDGYPVYRESWDGYTYVIKQVNSDITKDIVPKMQSLPNLAKNLILEGGDGSISYRQQCLIISFRNRENDGAMATNYIPDWIDMFAEDWKVYGI